MAQPTSAYRTAGLRARPGILQRIDLPRRVVFLAAASMIAIVALLLVFIAWQGVQLFLKDGVSVPTALADMTSIAAQLVAAAERARDAHWTLTVRTSKV